MTRTGERGDRSIGFVQARELKPRERFVLSDEWD